MTRYAGVCYDGPLEGEHRIEPRDRFRVPKLDGYNKDGYPLFSEQVYRWSYALRKWVFEG